MTTDLMVHRPPHLASTSDVDSTLVLPIGHLIEQALTLIDLWIVGGIATVVCGAACGCEQYTSGY